MGEVTHPHIVVNHCTMVHDDTDSKTGTGCHHGPCRNKTA